MWGKKAAAVVTSVVFTASSLLSPYVQAETWKQRSLPSHGGDFSFQGLGAADPLSSHVSLESAPSGESLWRRVPSSPLGDRLRRTVGGLSPRLGSVQKISLPDHAPPDAPIVVHIQDVHRHEEAQRNIGGLLSSLLETARPGLIGLEGAFSTIDVASYRAMLKGEAMRHAADALLRTHAISGPVHAALLYPGELPPVVGIDDEALHTANVDAYRRSEPRLKEVSSLLFRRERALSRRRASVYGAGLRAFDRRARSYHRKGGALADFIRALQEAGAPLPAEVRALAEALSMETALDFKEVERQRDALARAAAERLGAEDLEKLLGWTTAFRAGELTPGAYHARFGELCRRRGLAPERFPALAAYMRYLAKTEEIQGDALFDGLASAERAAYDRLAVSPAERALLAEDRALARERLLADFSLPPEEWDGRIPAGMESFADFYRAASARDQAMARNLLAGLRTAKASTAVLVTGGFHGPGMEKLLTRAGCAVVRVVPAMTGTDESGVLYLSAFTRAKSPLQKFFAGQRLFVSENPGPSPDTFLPISALEGEIHSAEAGSENSSGMEAIRRALFEAGSEIVIRPHPAAEPDETIPVRATLRRADGGEVELSGLHGPDGFEQGLAASARLTASHAAFLSAVDGTLVQGKLASVLALSAAAATGGAAYGVLRGTAVSALAVPSIGGRARGSPISRRGLLGLMVAGLSALRCNGPGYLGHSEEDPEKDNVISMGSKWKVTLGGREIEIFDQYPEAQKHARLTEQEVRQIQSVMDMVPLGDRGWAKLKGIVSLPRGGDALAQTGDDWITVFMEKESEAPLGRFSAHAETSGLALLSSAAFVIIHELSHQRGRNPWEDEKAVRLHQNSLATRVYRKYADTEAEEFRAVVEETFVQDSEALLLASAKKTRLTAREKGEWVDKTPEQLAGDMETFLLAASDWVMGQKEGELVWRAFAKSDSQFLDPVDHPIVRTPTEDGGDEIVMGFMTLLVNKQGQVTEVRNTFTGDVIYDGLPIAGLPLVRHVRSPNADDPALRPLPFMPVALAPKTGWGLFRRRTPSGVQFAVMPKDDPWGTPLHVIESDPSAKVDPAGITFFDDDTVGFQIRKAKGPSEEIAEVDDYAVVSRTQGNLLDHRSRWPAQVLPETAALNDGVLSIAYKPWIEADEGGLKMAEVEHWADIPLSPGKEAVLPFFPSLESLFNLYAWPAPSAGDPSADPSLWTDLPWVSLGAHPVRLGGKLVGEASARMSVALRGETLYAAVEVMDAAAEFVRDDAGRQMDQVDVFISGKERTEIAVLTHEAPIPGGRVRLFEATWDGSPVGVEVVWTDAAGPGDQEAEIIANGGTYLVQSSGHKQLAQANSGSPKMVLGLVLVHIASYVTDSVGLQTLLASGAVLAGGLLWPRIRSHLRTAALAAFLFLLQACSGSDGAGPASIEGPSAGYMAPAEGGMEVTHFSADVKGSGGGEVRPAPAVERGGKLRAEVSFHYDNNDARQGFDVAYAEPVPVEDIAFKIERKDLPADAAGRVKFEIFLNDGGKAWYPYRVSIPGSEWDADEEVPFHLDRSGVPDDFSKVAALRFRLPEAAPDGPERHAMGRFFLSGLVDMSDWRAYVHDAGTMKLYLEALGPDPVISMPAPGRALPYFQSRGKDVLPEHPRDIVNGLMGDLPGLSGRLDRVYAAPVGLDFRPGEGSAVLSYLPPDYENPLKVMVDGEEMEAPPPDLSTQPLLRLLAEGASWSTDAERDWWAESARREGKTSAASARADAVAGHASGSDKVWEEAFKTKDAAAVGKLVAAAAFFAVNDGGVGKLQSFAESAADGLERSPAPWIIHQEGKNPAGPGSLQLGLYRLDFGDQGELIGGMNMANGKAWVLSSEERIFGIPSLSYLRGDPTEFPGLDEAWESVQEQVAEDGTVVRIVSEGVGGKHVLQLQTPGQEPMDLKELPVDASLIKAAFTPGKVGVWIEHTADDVKGGPKTEDYLVFTRRSGDLLLQVRPAASVLRLDAAELKEDYAVLTHTTAQVWRSDLSGLDDKKGVERWYIFDQVPGRPADVADFIEGGMFSAKWGIFLASPSSPASSRRLEVRRTTNGRILHAKDLGSGSNLTWDFNEAGASIVYPSTLRLPADTEGFLVLDAEGELLFEKLPAGMLGRNFDFTQTKDFVDVTFDQSSGDSWQPGPALRYFVSPKLWQKTDNVLESPAWSLGEAVTPPAGDRTLTWRDVSGKAMASWTVPGTIAGIGASSLDRGRLIYTRIIRPGQPGTEPEDVWIVDDQGETLVSGVAPGLRIQVKEVGVPLSLRIRSLSDSKEYVWTPAWDEVVSPAGGWGLRLEGNVIGAPRTVVVTDGHGTPLANGTPWTMDPFAAAPLPVFTPDGSKAVFFQPARLPGWPDLMGGTCVAMSPQGGAPAPFFSDGGIYAFSGLIRIGNDGIAVLPQSPLDLPGGDVVRSMPEMAIGYDGSIATVGLAPYLRQVNESPIAALQQNGVLRLTPGEGVLQLSAKKGSSSIAHLDGTGVLRLGYSSAQGAKFFLGVLEIYGQDILEPSWIEVDLPAGGKSVDVDLRSLAAPSSLRVVDSILIRDPSGEATLDSLSFVRRPGGGLIEDHQEAFEKRFKGKAWATAYAVFIGPLFEDLLYTLPAALAYVAAQALGVDPAAARLAAFAALSLPFVLRHRADGGRRGSAALLRVGMFLLLAARPDAFWWLTGLHMLFNAACLLATVAGRTVKVAAAVGAAAGAMLISPAPARAQDINGPITRTELAEYYLHWNADYFSRAFAQTVSHPGTLNHKVLSQGRNELSSGWVGISLTPPRTGYRDPSVVLGSGTGYESWMFGGAYPWVTYRRGLGRGIDLSLHYLLFFGRINDFAPAEYQTKDPKWFFDTEWIFLHSLGGQLRWKLPLWRDWADLITYVQVSGSAGQKEISYPKKDLSIYARVTTLTTTSGFTVTGPERWRLMPYLGASMVGLTGSFLYESSPEPPTSQPSRISHWSVGNLTFPLHAGARYRFDDNWGVTVGAQVSPGAQNLSVSAEWRPGGSEAAPKRKTRAAEDTVSPPEPKVNESPKAKTPPSRRSPQGGVFAPLGLVLGAAKELRGWVLSVPQGAAWLLRRAVAWAGRAVRRFLSLWARAHRVSVKGAFQDLLDREIDTYGVPAPQAAAAGLAEADLGVYFVTDATLQALPGVLAAARVDGKTLILAVPEETSLEKPLLAAARAAVGQGGEPVLQDAAPLQDRKGLPDLLPMASLVGLLADSPETGPLIRNMTRAPVFCLPAGVEPDWTGVDNPLFRAAVLVVLRGLLAAPFTRESLADVLQGAELASTSA